MSRTFLNCNNYDVNYKNNNDNGDLKSIQNELTKDKTNRNIESGYTKSILNNSFDKNNSIMSEKNSQYVLQVNCGDISTLKNSNTYPINSLNSNEEIISSSNLEIYKQAFKKLDIQRERMKRQSLNCFPQKEINLSPNFKKSRNIIKSDSALTENIIALHTNESSNLEEKTPRKTSELYSKSISEQLAINSRNEKEIDQDSKIFNSVNNRKHSSNKLLTSTKTKVMEIENDIYHFKQNDYYSLKNFLRSPLEQGIWLQCKVEKNVFDKKVINYCLSMTNSDKFLLYSIKRPKKSYKIYMNFEKTESYLGKLKSNFFGTTFITYDSGKNPKKKDVQEIANRSNIAAITYETNLFGLKGPRKMKVYIPKVNINDLNPSIIQPKGDHDTIIKRINNNDEMLPIISMVNKDPTWSDNHRSFVLNFKNRNIIKSVKNFQLVEINRKISNVSLNDEILLQFGRTCENSYILDFKFPFSPIQAFSIALSSVDKKIACE